LFGEKMVEVIKIYKKLSNTLREQAQSFVPLNAIFIQTIDGK